MFEVKVELTGFEEAKKMVSRDLMKRIINKTVFNTAYDAKKDLVEEMKIVFDRPTPYILRSVTVRSEGWSMWTSGAGTTVIIGVEMAPMGGKAGGTDPADILRPHIEGGPRSMKPSERRLGNYWIPGGGARLNSYGNLSGGQITQLLSAMKLFEESGYAANITAGSRIRNRKPRNYFRVGWQNRGLHAGVWERKSGGKVKPILIFIRNPQYHIRLKFWDVLKRSINKNIGRRFNEAFDAAFTTMR